MSEIITTDIQCDVPGCDQWTSGPTSNRAARVEARKMAKHRGWKIEGRKATCPAHLPGWDEMSWAEQQECYT